MSQARLTRLVSYPLLHPQVMSALINQYKTLREKKDSGMVSWAFNFNDISANIESISKDLLTRAIAAKESIDGKKAPADVVTQWIKLIKFISEKAKELQNRPLDTVKNTLSSFMPSFVVKKTGMEHTDSMFAQTLHAIRTMIISQLSTHLEYRAEFNQRIAALALTIQTLQTEIKNDQLNGLDIKHKQEELDSALLSAAYLGHVESIIEATNKKLLTEYCATDIEYKGKLTKEINSKNVNIHVPRCFQQEWFLIFYETIFRPTTQQKFDDFVKSALKKKSSENAEDDSNEPHALDIIELDESDSHSDEENCVNLAEASSSAPAPTQGRASPSHIGVFAQQPEAESSSAPIQSVKAEEASSAPQAVDSAQSESMASAPPTTISNKQRKKAAKAAAAAEATLKQQEESTATKSNKPS